MRTEDHAQGIGGSVYSQPVELVCSAVGMDRHLVKHGILLWQTRHARPGTEIFRQVRSPIPRLHAIVEKIGKISVEKIGNTPTLIDFKSTPTYFNMQNIRLLPLLLAGYLFLLIFRPYEYWPWLGDLRIERVYMLCFMVIVFLYKDKRFLPSPINIALIFFGFALILSGLFSISWDTSWKIIEDYLKFFIFYFMIILCIKDEKDFQFIIVAFIGVMFLYVGKSAWEFFFHGRYVYRMGIMRMVGIDVTYGNPNAFAATICYSLPLTWAMIRYRFDNAWLRLAFWAYIALALVAIVYTGSRSGMVTALLFFFLVLLTTKRKILATSLFSVALILTWHVMPLDLQNRFLSTFTDDVDVTAGAISSAEGRMEGFKHGWYLFTNNPLTGIGPGNFPLSWPIAKNAHNLFGQVLGELGLLGALSFALLVLMILFKNKRIIKPYKAIHKSEVNYRAPPDSSYVPHGYPPVSKVPKPLLAQTANPEVGETPAATGGLGMKSLAFYSLVALAIIQTIILMLFKGWGDHNLYRYTWLLLAALTVLGSHLFNQELQRLAKT
jgi:O-antigen ligase